MKIGIITIQRSPNYGACLQAYGLYFFLKEKGYDCEVIDLLRPTHPEYNPSKRYRPYRIDTGLFARIKRALRRSHKHSSNNLTDEAKMNFNLFNDKIKYSRIYYSIDELYSDPPHYDVYITGSDQLWNPTIGFCIEPYFLTFVNNDGRKISYATSVGINELRDQEKADFSKWLADYYSISVREESARILLTSIIRKDVTQVCDPSFLLEPTQWKGMMIAPHMNSTYILLFTLSYNKALLDFCLRISHESKMKLVYLCLYQPENNKHKDYIVVDNAGPLEFLGYIDNADMVITNSFHGTVFSLILEAGNVFAHVPSSQKRGKRITDLLDTYHLSDHVLHDDLSISYKELEGRLIDKDSLRETMNRERKRSQEYLIKQLQ